VVAERASDLNSLLSSNKVSLLTREQTSRPRTAQGFIVWTVNESKRLRNSARMTEDLSLNAELRYLLIMEFNDSSKCSRNNSTAHNYKVSVRYKLHSKTRYKTVKTL